MTVGREGKAMMTIELPQPGNWQEFEHFEWQGRPADAERWTIYHTRHRDSGLSAQSNAAQVEQALAGFSDDVSFQRFSDWQFGWVDVVVVRVFGPDGEHTEAYAALCGLLLRLKDQPVLDETDHSKRVYETTTENIREATKLHSRVVIERLPDDFPALMFDWFWMHNDRAVQNADDQGGYPNDIQVAECVRALWPQALEETE